MASGCTIWGRPSRSSTRPETTTRAPSGSCARIHSARGWKNTRVTVPVSSAHQVRQGTPRRSGGKCLCTATRRVAISPGRASATGGAWRRSMIPVGRWCSASSTRSPPSTRARALPPRAPTPSSAVRGAKSGSRAKGRARGGAMGPFVARRRKKRPPITRCRPGASRGRSAKARTPIPACAGMTPLDHAYIFCALPQFWIEPTRVEPAR